MNNLNEILHELGISKVKLAKFLGVSRQMIYNYLELDDLNKWPKDKKVMLLNLLGVKTPEELETVKIDTDYILEVEGRLNNLIDNSANEKKVTINGEKQVFNDLGKKQKELIINLIDLMKERLEDPNDEVEYNTFKYLYNLLQSLDQVPEVRFLLAFFAKDNGFERARTYVFDEAEQYKFEGLMHYAMSAYSANAKRIDDNEAKKKKFQEFHEKFEKKIDNKLEEKMSRTMELNNVKAQALKELGYTTISEDNAGEVLEKIAEIQTRKIANLK